MDSEQLLALLQGGSIDPEQLQDAIAMLQIQNQTNQMIDLMNRQNLAAEAIDRANNPQMARFYDALAAARISGVQQAMGQFYQQ